MRPAPATHEALIAMRYLVVGGHGMLGRDLLDALDGRDVRAPMRSELDITDCDAVRAAVDGSDVIINAAAYTQVDMAEHAESEAFAVNAAAAETLAVASRATGARFVQISTDYVFRGDARSPYSEDAPLNPISAYGRSKAEGERRVRRASAGDAYIVRTAWLYGATGSNFARTISDRLRAGTPLRVVDDQVGQPTWSSDVARRIVELLDRSAPFGTYHATNSGRTSWYGFARAIATALDFDPNAIQPTDSAGFEREAPRPAFSVLGHEAWKTADLPPLRAWKAALTAAVHAGVLADR